MTTNVLLVRHGQTDSNVAGIYAGRSDEDLNEVGYSQIYRLSERLASLPIAAIYSSPLRRSYNSAVILAESHKLEPIVMDALIEIQAGDWQGLHFDDIKLRWKELWEQVMVDVSEQSTPNGESYRQVAQRSVHAFEKIVKAHSGERTVIMTHDIIIKTLVAYVLEVSDKIHSRFEIDNASLTVICGTDSGHHLITLNDVSHL